MHYVCSGATYAPIHFFEIKSVGFAPDITEFEINIFEFLKKINEYLMLKSHIFIWTHIHMSLTTPNEKIIITPFSEHFYSIS